MAGLYSSSITKARIIYAILLVLVVAGVSATKNLHAAAPPLELDGVGTNDCQIHLFCRSQSLTTSTGHDVIILIVETNSNITRVLDGSGLVFIQRVSYGIPRVWEYYARATSPLRSDNMLLPHSHRNAGHSRQRFKHGGDIRPESIDTSTSLLFISVKCLRLRISRLR